MRNPSDLFKVVEQAIKLLPDKVRKIENLAKDNAEKRWWKVVEKAIKFLPEKSELIENQPTQSETEVERRCEFLANLTKKIFSKKNEQVTSLLSQAQKISSTTCVQQVLKSIPIPPDYATLDKKQRRNYSHLHNLIDIILPLAAGSSSPESQLKLLENRWKYIHKEKLSKPVT